MLAPCATKKAMTIENIIGMSTRRNRNPAIKNIEQKSSTKITSVRDNELPIPIGLGNDVERTSKLAHFCIPCVISRKPKSTLKISSVIENILFCSVSGKRKR